MLSLIRLIKYGQDFRFSIADMQSTNKARHLFQSGDAASYVQSTMIGHQDFCLLSFKLILY